MPLRPELQSIFDALMKAHPRGPTLDDLSEETWNKPLTYADIDDLIVALEAAGVDLDRAEPAPPPEELVQVLTAARALGEETGKRPSVEEIASRAGLAPATVLRALRLGRALGAPK